MKVNKNIRDNAPEGYEVVDVKRIMNYNNYKTADYVMYYKEDEGLYVFAFADDDVTDRKQWDYATPYELNAWKWFDYYEDFKETDESLHESADEETPYTEEEVEADLKSLTNNWTNRDGSVRSGFKEEQRHAVNVLRRHYNVVDTSYDDRPGVQLHYIVAYSSPMSIGKDSDGNIVRDTKESVNESMEDYTQTYEVTVDQIPDNEYPFLNLAIGEGYIKVFTDGGDFYDFKCLNRAECDRKVIHDLGSWA